MSRKSSKRVASVVRSTKKNVSPSKSATSAPGAAGDHKLTPEREAELRKAIAAIPDEEILRSPGRVAERVRWASAIWISATRDVEELVLAPFFDEPNLTGEEIVDFRDRFDMLRLAHSAFMAVRGSQKSASGDFEVLAVEAAAHKETLLRAFTLRFRNDRVGLKRVAAIRKGSGDADLVQDVSDLLGLCVGNESYLARGSNGEAFAAKRLAEMSPKMLSLLGAKARDEGTRAAVRLRDGAYTLVQATERRIRAAAAYRYDGTPKMKEYVAYAAPKGAKPDPEDDVGDSALPTPVVAAVPAVVK
jgi:hypothetical protein